MSRPFPKEIYVAEEGEGEEGFLICYEDPRLLAEINEARQAAKYVKVENVLINNTTEVVK